MWDFILPNSDSEEAMPVSTRSKSTPEPVQTVPKKKIATPSTKDKPTVKKTSPLPTKNQPFSSNPLTSTAKTLVVSEPMEYNIVEDMKKIKANISLHELSKLKHQQKLLLKELNATPIAPVPSGIVAKAARGTGKSPDKVDATDTVLIGEKSNSQTPPFLLTYEMYNKNLHNCLIDSGASSNIMPTSVCAKLNIEPPKSAVHIV